MTTSKHHLQENKKAGWSEQEEQLLEQVVSEANAQGKPIKTVFIKVAEQTGRKPNSIRNYYYAKLKEEGKKLPAFEVFTQEEIRAMLEEILAAQAQGMSVRACTLKMGNGDNKAMLRYQNKYRSVIKHNPELVHEVMDSMRARGLPVYDPYALKNRTRAGNDLAEMLSGIVKNSQYADVDVTRLFESIYHLSEAACNGKKLMKKVVKQQNELEALQKERQGLLQKVRALEEKLEESKDTAALQSSLYDSNRENLNLLLSMFRQLVKLNKEFLGQTSVIKVSNLSEYINSLSRHMEECEQILVEYAK